MESRTLKTYQAQRALGWHAAQALRNARTLAAWDKLDGWTANCDDGTAPYERGSGYGAVRLRIVSDDSYDDSYIDTWSDVSEKERERIRADLWERIAQDGVCGVVGEYWTGDAWEHADSCFGFIGDDWRNSGYDVDIMSATMDAYVAHVMDYASELEATRPDMYAAR